MTENAPAKALLSLPNKPSIAVLTFANMSRYPEQEYFADGIVEEIIFSNRYFSDVLYPSLLPEFQRFTRLILAHRHLCSSGVFSSSAEASSPENFGTRLWTPARSHDLAVAHGVSQRYRFRCHRPCRLRGRFCAEQC